MKRRHTARQLAARAERNRPPVVRHRAGTATYDGNVEHIVGEVKGPTTLGQHLVAVDAHHDPDTDLTVVEFATLAEGDYLTRGDDGVTRLGTVPA